MTTDSSSIGTPNPSAVAATMWAEDNAAQLLGIVIDNVSPGHATATMAVRPDMTNGLGVCHGGILFTLADAAMAYASNAANERSVATNATVDFLTPALVGTTLVAVASQVAKPNRNAIHDVTVTSADGTLIAVFRGRTLSVGGPVIGPGTTP